MQTILALFDTAAEAEAAIGDLQAAGFETADIGAPALESRYYEEAVRRGGTLITFAVEDQEQFAALDIIKKHYPVDIKERAMAWHEDGRNADSVIPPSARAEEVAAAPIRTSSMGTMAAPTAQPTREVAR